MLSLKNFRSHAKGLPNLLPWAALIAPDIVLQKDGSLLAAWEVRGADTDSSTSKELEDVSARVNAGVMRLGSGWMLHVDAVRLPERAYPAREESHFPDRVTAMIEEERRAAFSQGQFFRTTTILSVVYKPPLATGIPRHAEGAGCSGPFLFIIRCGFPESPSAPGWSCRPSRRLPRRSA